MFGALPGKSTLLYASDGSDPHAGGDAEEGGSRPDANTYLPFKILDYSVMRRIEEEVEALGDMQEEREFVSAVPLKFFSLNSWTASIQLVGALTKALCCQSSPFLFF